MLTINVQILKIVVPIMVVGFILVWWKSGFLCAFGVFLMAFAASIREV